MRYHSRSLTLLLPNALVVTTLLSTGCVKVRSNPIAPVVLADDGAVEAQPARAAAASPEPPVSYELFPVEGPKSLAVLKARFGNEGAAAVLKLNRVDPRHLRRGERLIVPQARVDLLKLSPFPLEIETARAVGKLLLVSRTAQAFGAYESGRLVRWGPVSTGKKATPTPAGLYFTNWKARTTRSSVDSSWVLPWYFNIDSHLGVGIHQYDLPGYAASHGCVRMMEDDAAWVFGWADQWVLSRTGRSVLAAGTPVILFGELAHEKQPVWKRLPEEPAAARVSPDEIDTLLNKHLPVIEARTRSRQALMLATLVAQAASLR